MKIKHLALRLVGALWVAALLVAPLVAAADVPEAPGALASVIITEVQPGSPASANDEFIELYNTTDQPIDFAEHHWQLQIASSTSVSWERPYRTVDLVGVISPGAYYVVASATHLDTQPALYLPEVAGAWFSSGLSAAGGHIRLLYTVNQQNDQGVCSPVAVVVDEVEWSALKQGAPSTASLDGRTLFVTASSGGVASDSSLQRRRLDDHYLDTNNDAADFALGGPTPGQENTTPVVDGQTPQPAGLPPSVGLPDDLCDLPPPGSGGQTPGQDESGGQGQSGSDDTAAANAGLQPPQLTELLPNPAAPATDADDEFIELFNPNDSAFDLSGFTLLTGLTTLHRYVLPPGSSLPPDSYTVFYSRDSGLSLSNASGQVRLLDPTGALVSQTMPYQAAKEGESWALINDQWQWTTTPTPAAANVLSAPAVATTAAKTTVVKIAPLASKPAKTSSPKPRAGSVKGTATKLKHPKTKAAKPPLQPPTVATDTRKLTLLSPGVLAVAGLFAILYGAYEYRHDMANKIREFRADRAARRKARQGAARR